MVRHERLVNNAETTLNGSINNSTTSVTVTTGSIFPSEGDFRVIVDAEIMLVTSRATNVLTVVRGQEGTSAVSHDDDKEIEAIVTAGGMDKFVTDFLDPFAFNRPPNRLLDDSGNVLTSTDFTQGNFGTSTVIDESNGSITIKMESRAAPNAVALFKSAPSTPYTLTCHIMTGPGANASADNANVIGFRESGTSKLSFLSYHYANDSFTQYLADWDDATGAPANSSQENVPYRSDYWLRIEDDGTNLKYYRSANGYRWWEQHSELRGFHFTTGPDQIWWGGDCQGDDNEMIHLLAWIEE